LSSFGGRHLFAAFFMGLSRGGEIFTVPPFNRVALSRNPSAVTKTLCLFAALAACGCAHHKANQYAYAPPLAPPVYPQPQTAAQPVAYPAPAVVPAPGMAAPVMPPVAPGMVGPPAAAVGPPVMTVAGEVPALADGSCPPCNAGGASMAVPVGYEGAMQSPPCPPGP
jgi:hypothetical protein